MSIFIGLSSNLDDPRSRILEALDRIGSLPRTRLARCSSLYRTSPWGYADQPLFWNAVAQIESPDEPRLLLERLIQIERDMGRVRGPMRWGPRRIDLDLLLYHARRIGEPDLVVPHPHMQERVFVLLPLLEIAPNAGEPGTARPYALDLPGLRRPGDALLAAPSPIRG